ncbi:MAG: hypothetical protein ACTSR2_14230 [Candidatus Hodarchaeales archaeon]
MVANSIELVFPLITVLISFFFFLSVTEQYMRKHRIHQLIWAISMFLFMITSGAETLSLFLGFWDPLVYRLYYVLAAFQVSIMGAGALYLFASRNIINERNAGKILVMFGIIWTFFSFIFQFRSSIFLWILIPASFLTLFGILYWIQIRLKGSKKPFELTGIQFSHIFIIFTLYIFVLMTITAVNASLDLNYLLNSGGREVGGHGWLSDSSGARAVVRLFSPLMTISGGIALIGGAFYSYLSWQRSVLEETGRFNLKNGIFNLYIGGGALVLAIGGLLSGFGFAILYLSEVIAITLMYFGFLESDRITMQKMVEFSTLRWLRNRKDLHDSE